MLGISLRLGRRGSPLHPSDEPQPAQIDSRRGPTRHRLAARAWPKSSARRSSSFPRAPSGRRTTASGSATCCAARAQGRLHRRGVVRGTLEAKGFEERLMRLAPPPEPRRSPGSSGRTSSATRLPCSARPPSSSSASSSRRPGRRSIDGARYVDERLAEIFDELAPDVDRRGQRLCLPRDPGERPAMGADRLLQPARDEGPGAAAAVLRPAASTTARAGTTSAPSTARPIGELQAGVQGVLRRARRAAAARDRADPRVALAEPVPLPATSSTTARASARPDLAQPRRRACARPTRRGAAAGSRDGAARSIYLSLGSLGSADVALMQRLVEGSRTLRTATS